MFPTDRKTDLLKNLLILDLENPFHFEVHVILLQVVVLSMSMAHRCMGFSSVSRD